MTKVCLLQQNFCRKKTHVFVMTNICCNESLVVTKIFGRDSHSFVVASILLLRQKTCFVTTNVFAATKVLS